MARGGVNQERMNKVSRRGRARDLVIGVGVGTAVTFGSLFGADKPVDLGLEARVANTWNNPQPVQNISLQPQVGQFPPEAQTSGIYDFHGYMKDVNDTTIALNDIDITFISPDGVPYYTTSQADGSFAYAIAGDNLLKLNKRGTKVLKHILLERFENYAETDLERILAKTLGNATVGVQVNNAKTGQGIAEADVSYVSPEHSYFGETDSAGFVELQDVYTFVHYDDRHIPEGYELTQNYPNPFNPGTAMEFGLKRATGVKLYVFNIKGRLVKELLDKDLGPGWYRAEWDGTNKRGRSVAAGNYIALMTTDDGFAKTIKMIKNDGGGIGNSGFGNIGSYVREDAELHSIGKTLGHAYDATISKDGFVTLNKTETINADTTIVYELTSQNEFNALLIDNRTLKEIPNGIVEINGVEYRTDENGRVKVHFDPTVTELDSVRAWGMDAQADTASTFVVKYTDVPMDSSWSMPAGLMVTTYDSLTNVEEALRVNPQLFRDFMQEGNFIGGWPYSFPEGLKSIDFQNAQNPVPNPGGEHGYVYWIDRDFYHSAYPTQWGTFTEAEQNYIKDVIEREILSKIGDPTHRPQIYLAQPGEVLPIKPGETALVPDYGILPVSHRFGGNGYSFGWWDHDNDGIVDAVSIHIGDPTNLDGKITEETGSIIIMNPINDDRMKGKTAFSEGGATGYLTPADLKALGIEENISRDIQWQVTQLPSGLNIKRGHYKPLTHIDDILRINQ